MRLDKKLLRSKVSRRIFILFVSCALLPIGALTLFSSTFLGHELRDQASERLYRRTKAIGMAVMGRISIVESELKTVSMVVSSDRSAELSQLADHLGPRIEALAVVSDTQSDLLYGDASVTQPFFAGPSANLPLLEIHEGREAGPRIRLWVPLDRPGAAPAMLVGQINPDFLWNLDGGLDLPNRTELMVVDANQELLFSTGPDRSMIPPEALRAMQNSLRGEFTWHGEDRDALVQFWSLYLKPKYGYPQFTIVLFEPSDLTLAPLANVRKLLPLIVGLCSLVVLLASAVQIRKSLVPIVSLKQGTRQIAESNFDVHVQIDSNDEFQELAESFNAMALRIGKQFEALSTLAEMDRAILSTWREEDIVDTVLARTPERLRCDSLAVTLLDDTEPGSVVTRARWIHQDRRVTESAVLPLRQRRELIGGDGAVRFSRALLPAHLAAVLDGKTVECLVLPILRERIAGCVTLAYNEPYEPQAEQITEARRLTDQIAVALSNARLVDRLEQANWETLYALARAVDANSPWTAGHSERVTRMTLQLAARLGLPERERIILHRGGLLHDMGKIGVPNEILDKPGLLTDEEAVRMREHVTIGASILEPISAYREEMPIVLHHHERFDGSGYPDGLAGERIPYHARILAVADVYDALSSQRPYREAWTPKRVIHFIRGGAGIQFDPEIVWAFLELMEQEPSTQPQENRPWEEEQPPTQLPYPDFLAGPGGTECA